MHSRYEVVLIGIEIPCVLLFKIKAKVISDVGVLIEEIYGNVCFILRCTLVVVRRVNVIDSVMR